MCPLNKYVFPNTFMYVYKNRLIKDYIQSRGINVKDVLFIGDTDHDFAAASSVGCRCVLIAGGHQAKRVLEKCGVPVLDSIMDIPAFIQ